MGRPEFNAPKDYASQSHKKYSGRDGMSGSYSPLPRMGISVKFSSWIGLCPTDILVEIILHLSTH